VASVSADGGIEVWRMERFPSSKRSSWLGVKETRVRKRVWRCWGRGVRRVHGGTRRSSVRARPVGLQSVGNWA